MSKMEEYYELDKKIVSCYEEMIKMDQGINSQTCKPLKLRTEFQQDLLQLQMTLEEDCIGKYEQFDQYFSILQKIFHIQILSWKLILIVLHITYSMWFYFQFL